MIYTIGIDAGTGAFKGVLADGFGNRVAQRTRPVEYLYPEAGWVEANPLVQRQQLIDLVTELAAASPAPVAALAISGAAGSVMALDDRGNPTPIISWLDQRCQNNRSAIVDRISERQLRQITGWPCVDAFPLAQLALGKQYQPDRWGQARWVGLNSDYYQYTFSSVHAMDFSTAATMLVVDQQQRNYHSELLAIAGVRPEQLSTLIDPGREIGLNQLDIPNLAAGCRIIAGAFDHPSAARGGNVVDDGDLMLTGGTSYVGFFPIAERRRIMAVDSLLCDPFLSCNGGPWGAIFSVTALGRQIDDWVENIYGRRCDRFQCWDDDATVAWQQGGSNMGDGVKLAEALIAGNVSALEPELPRQRLALGLMVAAAHLLRSHLESLEQREIFFKRVKLTGGIARSPIFPLVLTAVTGMEIMVLDNYIGADGAAKLAREGYHEPN